MSTYYIQYITELFNESQVKNLFLEMSQMFSDELFFGHIDS